MAKALTINYNGKTYKAEFDRATAKAYALTGNRIQDVWENPFVAIAPFVHCAFKKNQPAITSLSKAMLTPCRGLSAMRPLTVTRETRPRRTRTRTDISRRNSQAA